VQHIIISASVRKKCRDEEKGNNEGKMKNMKENTAMRDGKYHNWKTHIQEKENNEWKHCEGNPRKM
jgi:hypothetical protein